MNPKIFAFWSGPRNVSTAMMYSFAQRSDTQVLDEPFFAYFLKQTGVWRPSREEALDKMETSLAPILESILQPVRSKHLFLKNMSNHMEGVDFESLLNYQNVILTREPRKVLSSYTAHIEKPSHLDLGYEHQLKIVEYLKSKNRPCLIVNSDDVCNQPEMELKRICEYLQIEFHDSMLQWEAGPREEDGVWAKYWYHNVHKSTGFRANLKKDYEIPRGLEQLLEESTELYHKILENR